MPGLRERMNDMVLGPEGKQGRKDFDPHERRDQQGRWTRGGGVGLTPHVAAVNALGSDPSAEAGAIEEGIAEADHAAQRPTEPGPSVPDEKGGPDTWRKYLQPSSYRDIQMVARGQIKESAQGLGPAAVKDIKTGLDDLEKNVMPKYGKSHKGEAVFRVTTLDHMPKADREKLAKGEAVTETEPGLLSLGSDRQTDEFIGEQTHPDMSSLVELRVAIGTDTKALDSRQKDPPGMANPDLAPEYVYPRGMKLHFTGRVKYEWRAFPLPDRFDYHDPENWTPRAIPVYEVTLQGGAA